MQLTPVKLCRFSRGLLQVELARRAQITHARLSEIESGRVDPRADELERLSQVLGIQADRLLASGAPQAPVPHLRPIHS